MDENSFSIHYLLIIKLDLRLIFGTLFRLINSHCLYVMLFLYLFSSYISSVCYFHFYRPENVNVIVITVKHKPMSDSATDNHCCNSQS